MRFIFIFFLLIFFTFNSYADEASIWLKKEIDTILQSYKNDSISSEKRFALIENTIPESAQVVAWGESTNAALKAKSISVDLVLNQPDINSLIDVLK